MTDKKYTDEEIAILNRLKVENEALISAQVTLQKHIEKQNAEIKALNKLLDRQQEDQ